MSHARRWRGYLAFAATVVAPAIGYLGYWEGHCYGIRETAFQAFRLREWPYAARQSDRYLRCNPEDQQVLHVCIESYYEARNSAQMHSCIDRTKLAFPEDPVADYWRAVLLIEEQQDFVKALPILKSVESKVETQYPKVNLYLGMALTKSGDIQAGCANIQYYLNSPFEGDNHVRRAAAETYRSQCTDTLP